SAEARIAGLRPATLQPCVPARVLAWTKPCVAGNLAPITKAVPIAELPVEHDAGHFAQAARLLGSSRALQLHAQGGDLLLQRYEDGLRVGKQLSHPLGASSAAKGRGFHQFCTSSKP